MKKKQMLSNLSFQGYEIKMPVEVIKECIHESVCSDRLLFGGMLLILVITLSITTVPHYRADHSNFRALETF